MLQWPDITDTNKYYIFDSQNGEIVRKLETGKDTLLLMGGWSPDGQLVAAGDYEGTVYFWEASSGELVKLSPACPGGISSSGRRMAVRSPCCALIGIKLDAIQVVDAETYELPVDHRRGSYDRPVPMVSLVAGQHAACIGGGSDEMGQVTNPVYVYDASSGEELLKISGHTSQVSGSRLVSGWEAFGERQHG
jgi:WD40 repeat protein